MELILAEPEQFDALWESFMEQLFESNYKELEQKMTQLAMARDTFWNDFRYR